MRMKNGIWWTIIIVLLVIIVGLAWLLFTTPAPADRGGTNATSTATTTGGALHDRVVIDAPKSGQTVFKSFTATGKAPGNWYFEASFPIKVVDPQGNVVATGQATALSDWMTTADVPFKADIRIDSYTGPATLVLMRDNPSGLPANDDSVSVPITVQ